jgi:SAM-dependent methyltransferase
VTAPDRAARAHAYENPRPDLQALVPAGARRVLDLGCASGALGAALREGGAEVVGIERDPEYAVDAAERLDRVLNEDLETFEGWDGLGAFDVVIAGDVLEHLRDPWTVLAWLRTLLPTSGKAIISLPNIAHWTARRALSRGRFAYADFGLFDRTHLRFFTRDSAQELARRAGFAVRRALPAGAPLPLESRFPALARVRDPSVRRCPGLLALQFVLVLTPADQPRP